MQALSRWRIQVTMSSTIPVSHARILRALSSRQPPTSRTAKPPSASTTPSAIAPPPAKEPQEQAPPKPETLLQVPLGQWLSATAKPPPTHDTAAALLKAFDLRFLFDSSLAHPTAAWFIAGERLLKSAEQRHIGKHHPTTPALFRSRLTLLDDDSRAVAAANLGLIHLLHLPTGALPAIEQAQLKQLLSGSMASLVGGLQELWNAQLALSFISNKLLPHESSEAELLAEREKLIEQLIHPHARRVLAYSLGSYLRGSKIEYRIESEVARHSCYAHYQVGVYVKGQRFALADGPSIKEAAMQAAGSLLRLVILRDPETMERLQQLGR